MVKLKLMAASCYSVCGSELWDISLCEIEDVCIAWSKALKRDRNVPLNTHTNLIYNISDILPLKHELYRRNLLFDA